MMDTVNLLAEIEVLKRRLENAVEVVRCKECVHKGVDADDEPYCELHNMGIYADDYCSYGERTNGQTLNLADE